MRYAPTGPLPSDCPPVTDEDRARILATVGDPAVPGIKALKQKCRACKGHARVTKADGAPAEAGLIKRADSEPCPRCAGKGTVTVLSLDELARKWVSCADFADLVHDVGGISTYRPSIRYPGNKAGERNALANAYDAVQAARGDKRRAA